MKVKGGEYTIKEEGGELKLRLGYRKIKSLKIRESIKIGKISDKEVEFRSESKKALREWVMKVVKQREISKDRYKGKGLEIV